jgi:hypothetical protein
MPRPNSTTDIVNDPLYHKKYYINHKEDWGRYQKKNYCKRVYKIEFTDEEIQEMEEDYKLVARHIRDSKIVLEKYKELLDNYQKRTEPLEENE